MKAPVKVRGSAILEVLIAGTILLIGMTGISLLLLRAYGESRDATLTVSAAQYAARRVQEFTVVGTSVLATLDGGNAPGGQPVPEDPRFTEMWTVTDQSDAGVVAYQVDVTVNWNGATRGLKSHQISLVVSEIPDGGF